MPALPGDTGYAEEVSKRNKKSKESKNRSKESPEGSTIAGPKTAEDTLEDPTATTEQISEANKAVFESNPDNMMTQEEKANYSASMFDKSLIPPEEGPSLASGVGSAGATGMAVGGPVAGVATMIGKLISNITGGSAEEQERKARAIAAARYAQENNPSLDDSYFIERMQKEGINVSKEEYQGIKEKTPKTVLDAYEASTRGNGPSEGGGMSVGSVAGPQPTTPAQEAPKVQPYDPYKDPVVLGKLAMVEQAQKQQEYQSALARNRISDILSTPGMGGVPMTQVNIPKVAIPEKPSSLSLIDIARLQGRDPSQAIAPSPQIAQQPQQMGVPLGQVATPGINPNAEAFVQPTTYASQEEVSIANNLGLNDEQLRIQVELKRAGQPNLLDGSLQQQQKQEFTPPPARLTMSEVGGTILPEKGSRERSLR